MNCLVICVPLSMFYPHQIDLKVSSQGEGFIPMLQTINRSGTYVTLKKGAVAQTNKNLLVHSPPFVGRPTNKYTKNKGPTSRFWQDLAVKCWYAQTPHFTKELYTV